MDKKTDRADSAWPIVDGKEHEAPSVFRPEALLREARSQRRLPLVAVPQICALDPDGDVVRHLKRTDTGRTHEGWACYHTELLAFDLDGVGRVGIVGCAVGASFAVLVAEKLFASCCRLLISVTSAGQITPIGPTPYFVLIDRALRDEGTSYHYLPGSTFARRAMRCFSLVWNRRGAPSQTSRYIGARRGRRMHPIARPSQRSRGRASWAHLPSRWRQQPYMPSVRRAVIRSSASRMSRTPWRRLKEISRRARQMARRRRWPLSPLRPALGADSGEHIARRDRSISDDVNTRCSSPQSGRALSAPSKLEVRVSRYRNRVLVSFPVYPLATGGHRIGRFVPMGMA
jgi:hypothetical protein